MNEGQEEGEEEDGLLSQEKETTVMVPQDEDRTEGGMKAEGIRQLKSASVDRV